MRLYEESHSGWTTRPDWRGGYDILDANGWALATLAYDYRYTCNATNHARAHLLSAAPDYAAGVEQMLAWEQAGGDGWWKGWEMLKAAHAKATGQPKP